MFTQQTLSEFSDWGGYISYWIMDSTETVVSMGDSTISLVFTSTGVHNVFFVVYNPMDSTTTIDSISIFVRPYDTASTSTRNFFGIDSIFVSSTPHVYLDSFVSLDSKIYTHDTETTTFYIVDSVYQTITHEYMINHCDSSVIDSSLISIFDTVGHDVVLSVDSVWTDTVSCIRLTQSITEKVLFDSVAGTTSSISIYDSFVITGGYVRTLDSIIVTPYIVDSHYQTDSVLTTINNCTNDTSTSIASTYIKTVIAIFADTTHIYRSDTIWCAYDTIRHLTTTFVENDSFITHTTPYVTHDSTTGTAGIFRYVILTDSGTQVFHNFYVIYREDSFVLVTNHCSGDTTENFSALVRYDSDVVATWNDSTHHFSRDTVWCTHDTTISTATTWTIDTTSITPSVFATRDSIVITSGYVIAGDSGTTTTYAIDTMYRVDTTMAIVNGCTLDTARIPLGYSSHAGTSWTVVDSGVHHFYSDTTLIPTNVLIASCPISVKVFPNPFTENVTIQTSGEFEVTVFDMLGQQIISDFGTETKEIRFSNLASATYTIVVKNKCGLVYTAKIVKN